MNMQLRHAEYQSQCSQHKERLARLHTTYHALKNACDKRVQDLHRIDRTLEQTVNARFAVPLCLQVLGLTNFTLMSCGFVAKCIIL